MLTGEGWKPVGGKTFKKGNTTITLSAVMMAFLDKLRDNSFRNGFERGAYEAMTMEDADPLPDPRTVKHVFDPDGPELPDPS